MTASPEQPADAFLARHTDTGQFLYLLGGIGGGGHAQCKSCGKDYWRLSGSGAEVEFWMRDHACPPDGAA